jgi:predicted DNA-binding transcriptional regulator AlpA
MGVLQLGLCLHQARKLKNIYRNCSAPTRRLDWAPPAIRRLGARSVAWRWVDVEAWEAAPVGFRGVA